MTQDQTPPAQKKPRRGFTWAQAVRDITNQAINRGQLPVLGIIVILLMLIWKMPQEQVGTFVMELLAAFRTNEILGWFFSVILALGWFFHARIMRRLYSLEFERIGREKSSAQSKAGNTPYRSSDEP